MVKPYHLALMALVVALPLASQVPLSSTPARNAVDVALCSQITLTYPQGTSMVELQDPSSLVVRGNLLGSYRSGTELLEIHATSVTFTPSCPFLPGELVTVTVTIDSGLTPVSFQFKTTAQTHGQGNFQPRDQHALASGVPAPLPEEPAIGLALGDLDGDQDVDIVVADRGSGQILTFLNKGAGIFLPGASINLSAVLDVALILSSADPTQARFNIVATRYEESSPGIPSINEAVLLVNDGTGRNFTTGSTVGFPLPPGATRRVRELAVVDMDDDGLDDVAVSFSSLGGTANEDGVALLKNTPASGLVLQSGFLLPPPAPAGLEPRGMDVADLDNDWNLDLALAGAGFASVPTATSGGIAMVLGPLDATPPPQLTAVVGVADLLTATGPETAGAVAIHLVDLDPPASGPGYPDMVSLHRSVTSGAGQVFVFLHSEANPPTFAAPGLLLDSGTSVTREQRGLGIGVLESSIAGFDVVCGGVNSQQTPHAVTTAIDASGAPGVVNLMGLGGIAADPQGLEDSPKAFALGDLDGDGDLDLAVLTDRIVNNLQTTFLQIFTNGNTGPAVVRFDQVAGVKGLANHTYILHGVPTLPTDGEPGQPNEHGPGLAVADFDGDGIDDLFLPHETDEVGLAGYTQSENEPQVYFGSPSGGFSLAPAGTVAEPAGGRLVTGAAACDYDNDGDQDVYMICGSNLESSATFYPPPPTPMQPLTLDRLDLIRNVLYRNTRITPNQTPGPVQFEDVSSQTGPWPAAPGNPLSSQNCNTQGVVDPTAPAPGILENMCWIEDTQGNSTSVPLGDTIWAAWADVNRDGLPDLYVGNHGGYGAGALQRDALYIQKPDHTFFLYEMPLTTHPGRSVTGSLKPSATEYNETLAGTFADLNNDGWPDIYVTNALGQQHVLYENLGRNSPPAPPPDVDAWPAGVPFVQFAAHGLAHTATVASACATGPITPEAMGIAVGDLDGDGDLDLYLTDTEGFPNQDNDVYTLDDPGLLLFTHRCGLATGGFCWGCTTHDYDNDGNLDLFAASNLGLSNFFYRNTGPPLGFMDQSGEALALSILESRGAVNLDFDLDGRMDILVINKTSPLMIPQAINPPSLYQNVTTQAGSFLKIKLVGDHQVGKRVGTETLFSSRDALNARIKVLIGGAQPRTLMAEVIAFGSNAASTHTLIQHFGLGPDTGVIQVTISWPSGREQTLLAQDVDPFVQEAGQGAASVLVITEDANL